MQTFFEVLLASFTLILVSLQTSYHDLPLRELKRRAHHKDLSAVELYKAVGFGASLKALIWILIIASSSGFFVLIARRSSAWVAFLACCLVVWLGFVWLPDRRVSRLSKWAAIKLAPMFAWLLKYLHPPFNRLRRLRKSLPAKPHTGLFEKEDLLELLERQQAQTDNRIEQFELQVSLHSLTFGDLRVNDCLVSKSEVKAVKADEPIGPMVMAELHGSGHTRFPVYNTGGHDIIGTLFLTDLVDRKQGGIVREVMRPGVWFAHEDQSLAEILQAMLKVRQHLFVVVDSREKYRGIITIEEILERIIGSPIPQEFDQYDDRRAVAHRFEKVKSEKVLAEPTEVVE